MRFHQPPTPSISCNAFILYFGLEQFVGRDNFGPTLFMLLGLSPGFCLADVLVSLALRRQGMKFQSGEQPLDWDITGASMCYLVLESIIYFVLVMGFDLLPSTCVYWTLAKSWFTQKLDSKHYSGSPKGIKEPFIIFTIESHASVRKDEDEDVRAERLRVLSGETTDSIIYLKNLRKVYPGGVNQPEKVAVQSLSFSVHEGECFGFLGTNGAGKSTTLSMLSDEGYPSEGNKYFTHFQQKGGTIFSENQATFCKKNNNRYQTYKIAPKLKRIRDQICRSHGGSITLAPFLPSCEKIK